MIRPTRPTRPTACRATFVPSSLLAGCPVRSSGSPHYTDRLGWKLGPVPFGWPLLACAILFGSREAVSRLFPRFSHGQMAVGVGVAATLTDLNLEPLAW